MFLKILLSFFMLFTLILPLHAADKEPDSPVSVNPETMTKEQRKAQGKIISEMKKKQVENATTKDVDKAIAGLGEKDKSDCKCINEERYKQDIARKYNEIQGADQR
jgi:hypothetical protein